MPFGIEVDGIAFSEQALVERPAHAAVLGRIFTSWSLIESSIAALLGLMMHADHRAAVAILGTFKSNNSRVTAVKKVGKAMLDASLRDEFDKLMKDVLAYAKERNDIAHGLWGSNKNNPEVVYRVPMTAVSEIVVRAPNNAHINTEELVKSFKVDMTVLTVADLERTEQKGHDLLQRVMNELTKKAYSRALEHQRHDAELGS